MRTHRPPRRPRILIAATVLALTSPLSSAGIPAHAEPETTVAYPAGSSATHFSGLAFDTCTAPGLAAMSAWRASPYRAVGVYIGGETRTCAQPELTASWVSATAAMGWRHLPIYKGRQPWCGARPTDLKITADGATAEGTAAARDAVVKARSLGMRPGTAVYLDVEHYNATDTACRTAVLRFVTGYVRQMHRLGYLAGVYGHLYSGAKHLSESYSSTTYARPDALWIARWDLSTSLTGWTGIPDGQWANRQRAKQYRGGHDETYGGVRLNIDSDSLNVPVATVARRYTVQGTASLNARIGPSGSYAVVRTWPRGSTLSVLCQARGQLVGGTRVWDRLHDGTWVSDRYVSTPSTTGFSSALPKCLYPYQTTSRDGLNTRSGPGASYAITGRIPYGSLAWVACQRAGSLVGATRVWDRLHNGSWVSDHFVATPSRTTYSTPLPRCY